MRKMVMLLAAFALLAGASLAAESRKVELLDGIYSLEVPADWFVQEEQNGQGTVLSDGQSSPYHLVIGTPIPGIDDLPQYVELMVAAVCKGLGSEGAVMGEGVGEADGHTAMQSVFVIPRANGENFGGMIDAEQINGYTVTMLAVGPAKGFQAFLAKAQPVMESYELDADAMDDHHDELEEIGEATVKGLLSTVQ